MSTLVTNDIFPTKHRLLIKGAYEYVLRGCTKYVDSEGNIRAYDEAAKRKVAETIKKYCDLTLRVFVIAYRDVSPELVETFYEETVDNDGNKIRPIEEKDIIL